MWCTAAGCHSVMCCCLGVMKEQLVPVWLHTVCALLLRAMAVCAHGSCRVLTCDSSSADTPCLSLCFSQAVAYDK